MILPPIDEVVKVYSKFIDKEDVDSANRFLASVAAMAAYYAAAEGKGEEVRKYIEELREKIVEGPEMLNPYVFGLLGDLIEDPSDLEAVKERLRLIWGMDQLGLED
ncbi:hypothetical protein [Ignicoccus hospitalis]|uniref:Uncharacterized protein n=1 Tax=Ignicoccus hospitalis (strain KIN4/I / DSM 18386 / JCM 14125) TaxID=453591 RepID=A8AAL0_IGNH4|nr:hypothetical protein [Ignicoccus hospitalis]ABU81962.1 hypothetical protein Igni_0780 [Ignicoccus hospitalis KIN4/I]HIH89879.1 hypothetical protein [Desulfurococcaceae archaeon]